MQEKVSIIVPIYNVEQWLDECVQSIVKQTYKNIEIILVDDGSTDNSGKICEEWKIRDKRIAVVHKTNGGLSSARNAGLDNCTGDYITFVDSDDYIHSDTIKHMLKDMKDKNVSIVRCAMNKIVNGKVIDSRDINQEKLFLKQEMLERFFYYQDGFCGSVCDKLFKAEIFKTLRFPEGLNSEDYFVLFNAYLNTDAMFYNNKCFYNYRIRENSICTTQSITPHTFDKIKISDKIRAITDQKMPERVEDAKAFQMLSRFFVYSEIIYRNKNNENKKKWIAELKQYKKSVYKNKKIDLKFKVKYFIFIYFTGAFVKYMNTYKFGQ